MGREATCLCQLGETTGHAKALLESHELILRGEIRRRIPIAQIGNLRIEDDRLAFTHNDCPISLTLGPALARKWEAVLRKPPTTLAAKLGITPSTRIHVIGQIDDPNLDFAIQTAAGQSSQAVDLILARLDTPEDLLSLLRRLHDKTPLWVIFPKRSGHPLAEALIRSTLRDRGLIDVKVASVSPRLTALRFHHRLD
jgi:hypothetical protein